MTMMNAMTCLTTLGLLASSGVAHAGTIDEVYVSTQISNGLAPAYGIDVELLGSKEGPARFILGSANHSYVEVENDGVDVCVWFWSTNTSTAQKNCQAADGSDGPVVTTYEGGVTVAVAVSEDPLPLAGDPDDGVVAYAAKDCPPPSTPVYTTIDGSGFLGSISEWVSSGSRSLSSWTHADDVIIVDCWERGEEPGHIGGRAPDKIAVYLPGPNNPWDVDRLGF